MEIEKCLLGLVGAASLVCGFATSWAIARGVTQNELSQPPAITATITHDQSSSSSLAGPKLASSDPDLAVKRYYFDHLSEFAPLPQSARERAEALHQIEDTIRQKLAAEKRS